MDDVEHRAGRTLVAGASCGADLVGLCDDEGLAVRADRHVLLVKERDLNS